MAMNGKMVLAGIGLLGLAVAAWGPDYLRAASVLMSSVRVQDPTHLTAWVSAPITEQDITLETQGQVLGARIYTPQTAHRSSPVLLVHGVHPLGMDEPRFRTFARSLAGVGHVVMTPALPELSTLLATSDTVTRITAAAAGLQARAEGPVTIVGISVGGGLSLLSASEQPRRGPIAKVVAIGAHDDLVRVARHYAGVPAQDAWGSPSGVVPHPYGIRVLALAHAEHLFAEADVTPARELLQACLAEQRKACRARLPELSEEGRELMAALLDDPHGDRVSRALLRAVDEVKNELRAVSPADHLGKLKVPVLLLHGASDPVVPATELSHLSREVPKGLLQQSLITPVLSHVDFPEGVGLMDYLRVVQFTHALLRP